MRKSIICSIVLTAIALADIYAAQSQPQVSKQEQSSGSLKVHQLTSSVYWAEGGIGNVGFIIGDKGVIVIDTTMTSATGKELLDDIARITPKPISTVILTHIDTDHIGGLPAFPSGIRIIAQENTKKGMDAALAAGRGSVQADHLPNHTVVNREDIEINGVKLELLHWAPAHTSGDLVVFLPAQKIVFTGDIIVMDQPRALIHRESQGNSEGWVTSAKAVTDLDADRFVVGHGDVQTKEGIRTRVNMVAAEREKIKELVAKGMPLSQIQAEVDDPPKDQSAYTTGAPRFTSFSEVVYQELTEKNK